TEVVVARREVESATARDAHVGERGANSRGRRCRTLVGGGNPEALLDHESAGAVRSAGRVTLCVVALRVVGRSAEAGQRAALNAVGLSDAVEHVLAEGLVGSSVVRASRLTRAVRGATSRIVRAVVVLAVPANVAHAALGGSRSHLRGRERRADADRRAG